MKFYLSPTLQTHHLSTIFECFLILFLALLLIVPSALLASDPIQIAATNSADALAFSNSRKIVRTSTDKLVVIYQDSGPSVKMVYSDDGVNWIPLIQFGHSSQPALAIGPNDEIYACWIDSDTKDIAICAVIPDTSADPIIPIKIWTSWGAELQHPALEATNNSVDLVYQISNGTEKNTQFERFSKDLRQTYSAFVGLSEDIQQFLFPTIVGDLYFDKDLTFMFWNQINTQTQKPIIHYASMEEHVYPDSIAGVLLMGSDLPFPDVGISSASLSAATNTLVAAMVPSDKSFFITSMMDYSPSGFEIVLSDTIYVSQDPTPSVDDVYIQSCAVCWRDSNRIYYSQNHDGKFLFEPIPVSGNDVHARQPNVCYKTFRQDIFDVVWLEGDAPPFHVMYRRMKKDYGPVNVEKSPEQLNVPKNFALFPCYPNPFNQETVIPVSAKRLTEAKIFIYDVNGKLVKQIFSGHLGAGLHKFHWNARNETGEVVSTGLYFVRMEKNGASVAEKIILVK